MSTETKNNHNDVQIRVLDIGSANQRFSGGLQNIENKYVIGFEPDKRTLANCSSVGEVLPVALAGKVGERTLFLTRKPECSSFFKPNREYLDLLPDKERWDILSEELILCQTLNSLNNKIGDNDFIKIDTQGSELEILEGGVGNVLEQILGIECEVEFVSVYENQPLFGDVCAFLNQQGFDFYDFVVEYRYGRKKLDRTGQLAFADALFLRTPEYMYRMYKEGAFSYEKIKKYKVIVRAYKKGDLADVLDTYLQQRNEL